MVATSFIAASSLFALAFGAPIRRDMAARSLVARATYTVYSGDGTTQTGWPSETSWLSFDDLWKANLGLMKISCAQFGVPENTDNEISAIKSGLIAASKESGVSQSYLLAIMMQESKGCVRAPTTNYGVRNPGLFQDFNGVASCNDGTVITPCPEATIHKMISEGAGIGMEVGLSIGIAATGTDDVSKYYKAARIYNSGSVDPSGNMGKGIATHCYVSDIANRLMGWTTETSTCSEANIGSLNGGAPSTPTTPAPVQSSAPAQSSAPSTPVQSSTPSTPEYTEAPSTPEETETPSPPVVAPVVTPTPSAAPTPAAPEAEVPVETTTPEVPVTGAPANQYPGAVKTCKTWYDVKAGDDCRNTGVDMATLTSLNSGLDSACSNLWLGSSYCIAA